MRVVAARKVAVRVDIEPRYKVRKRRRSGLCSSRGQEWTDRFVEGLVRSMAKVFVRWARGALSFPPGEVCCFALFVEITS